jgi:hypothetical protein
MFFVISLATPVFADSIYEAEVKEVFAIEVDSSESLDRWISENPNVVFDESELRDALEKYGSFSVAVLESVDGRTRNLNHVAWLITGHGTQNCWIGISNNAFGSVVITGTVSLFGNVIPGHIG